MYPHKVHVLKSIDSTSTTTPMHFGVQRSSSHFILSFVRGTDAINVTRKITLASTAELVQYSPRNVAQVVKEELLDRGIVYGATKIIVDESAIVKIKKLSSPQFEWIIENKEFSSFMMLPFSSHVGVVVAKTCVEETDQHFLYEAEVVEPAFDAELFRSGLERLM